MNEMNGKLDDDDEDNGNLTKPHRLPRSHHVKNTRSQRATSSAPELSVLPLLGTAFRSRLLLLTDER